ncbi:medium-chain fatty acid-CoA ligase faa2, partial [Coemansia helicoidea]
MAPSVPQQSYRVPGSEEPGYSYTIRHPDCKDSLAIPVLPGTYHDSVFEMLQSSAALYADAPFVGTRSYDRAANKFGGFQWMTYAEVYSRALNIGSGLVRLMQRHVRPGADVSALTRLPLGLYSVNRAEWLLADYAGMSQNMYSVALYDTLGAESIEFILNHAEVEVLVCSLDKIPKILKLREKLPLLKAVVCMDSLSADAPDATLPSPFNTDSVAVLKQWAEAAGVALYDLATLEEMGAAEPVAVRIPKTTDMFCLCYTSGTTGTPKAAMILHSNMAYVQRAVPLLLPRGTHPVSLAYLPLAHIYERSTEVYVMSRGGQIGMYSGNILNVVDDLQTLRPTMFCSVPRLLNRIYDRLVAGTIHAPGLTGVLARRAIGD